MALHKRTAEQKIENPILIHINPFGMTKTE